MRNLYKLASFGKRKWEPDYSSPEHIRMLVIRESRPALFNTMIGVFLLASAMCELVTVFISLPSLIVLVCEKYPGLPWLVTAIFINGVALSAVAGHRGIVFLQKEEHAQP